MGPDRTLPRQLLIVLGLLVVLALIALSTRDTPGEIRGLVTSVEGTLTGISTFDVVSGGTTYRFSPSPDGDFEFPLPHLRDHLRGGEPVVVAFTTDGSGALVATSIGDG